MVNQMMTQNDYIIVTLAYHRNAKITPAGIKPGLETNQWLRTINYSNFSLKFNIYK